MFGAVIAGAGGAFLGSALMGGTNALLNPALLPAHYFSNWMFRSLLPSVPDIFNANTFGTMSDSNATILGALNNIQFYGNNQNQAAQAADKAWQDVFTAGLPKLSHEQLLYCLYSGILTAPQFISATKDWKMLKEHIRPLHEMSYSKFDLGTIFSNYFRGEWDITETIKRVRRLYGCNKPHAEQIIKSQQYIAPPSDLLRFVVKDVFDDAQIQALGLDAEYDTVAKAIPWANALGIPKETKIKYNGQEISLDMLRAYWISHWQLMSPTQGYNALHRLRPNRITRYNQAIPGLKPFEFDQLNALLKSNDYVPEQRKWLAASAYTLLGRIDLRRVFESGEIDETELNERYQDAGYAKVDADLLTRYSVAEKKKKDEEKDKKKLNKALSKKIAEVYLAYEIGAIGKSTASQSLISMKVDELEVQGNLDAIDLRINRKRMQQYIKMVKDEMFLGLYTGQEAYEQLTFGGVEGYRASQYVIQWQRALSRPRRVASVNTVMAWVKDGLMNFADASSRLEKLGFSNADTLLYLQSAKMDIDKKILMEQIAQQRTENQRIKETERLFRQQVSDLKASQAQLRTYSSIPTMKRWYINDLMDWGTIFQRLQFLGVDMTDINRYKEEWDNEKASGQ